MLSETTPLESNAACPASHRYAGDDERRQHAGDVSRDRSGHGADDERGEPRGGCVTHRADLERNSLGADYRPVQT